MNRSQQILTLPCSLDDALQLTRHELDNIRKVADIGGVGGLKKAFGASHIKTSCLGGH